MYILEFLMGLSLISMVGWIANKWIRARYGVEHTSADDRRPAARQLDAICAENEELKEQLKQLQERMAVMERIATDPAERTAREIESLR